MKKIKFLKTLLVLIGVLIGSVTTQMWAASSWTSDGTAYLYYENGKDDGGLGGANWVSSNGNVYIYFWNDKGDAWSDAGILVSGTKETIGAIYAINIPSGTWTNFIVTRGSAASWDGRWNQTGTLTPDDSKNKISGIWVGGTSYTKGTYTLSSTGQVTASSSSVAPSTAVTLTPSITSNTTYNAYKSVAYSVSPGTSGTDWTIAGNTFTPLKEGTYTITATITYNAKGFTGITSTVAPTVSVTCVSTPSITLAVKNSGGSAITTAKSGETITLAATTTNCGSTPTISYRYSTSSTFDTYTQIASTTSTSQTWTVPDDEDEVIYYIRAYVTTAGKLCNTSNSTLTAYGKKTIMVKVPDAWGTVNLYTWNSSSVAQNGTWPGTSGEGTGGLSCTQQGEGYWWEIVLYSNTAHGFVLNCNSSGDDNKTEDLSYANYTDGNCYAITTANSPRKLPTSTVSCLSAPSVTTSSVTTPTVNDKATIGGDVTGLGNDKVTSYGYYYSSTNSSLAGNNLEGATRVEVGTNKTATGTYSKEQTGLTGGKTYYVIAYATNGHSTVYGSRVSFTTPYKVTLNNPATGGSFSSSGVKYVSSTLLVSITATTGYTFSSWTAVGCEMSSTSTTSGVTTATLTPSADNATLTAVYTENSYPVSISVSPASSGSITTPTPSEGKITVKQVTGTDVTTAPAANYAFVNWTYADGGITASSTTSKTCKFKATTTGGSIQANFADKWNVKGGDNVADADDALGNWATYNGMPYAGSANTFSKSFSLPAKTTYHFKIVKRADAGGDDVWYGVDKGKTLTRASSSVTGLESGGAGDEYITFTTDAAGTYTITYVYNASEESMQVSVGYPTAYTVEFGSDGHGTVTATASATGSLTTGDYVGNGETVTFSHTPNTGYTLDGWYTTVDGSTSAGLNGDNELTINAAKTVYAQYNAKTYTVTLDQQDEADGHGSDGATSLTATYDAAFPTTTMPTAATGYAFMGYWSAAGGEGTQFTDASGNLLAGIEGYSDENGKWKYDASDLTLYAYYKQAEITRLTLDAEVVETNGTVGVTPTISPIPEGDYMVCFWVYYSNDNPLNPQPTITRDGLKATFPAGEVSGTYKIGVALHTGTTCSEGSRLDTATITYQVAGLHDVTVRYKCGDDVIAASTTSTGRPLEWTEVVAHEIFGYTFSSWTAGDGVTITDADPGRLAVLQAEDATIVAVTKMKAVYDGYLTANYTQKQMIYFKNTLEWEDVYVNFYTASDWDNTNNDSGSPKGCGNSGLTNRNKHMTQIDDTDIWYYDYGYNGGGSSITPTSYISFTDQSRDGVDEFWGANASVISVSYPANYADAISTDRSSENGFKAATPMFVPLANQEPVAINVTSTGKANYYNRGYWTKYTAGTGYTLEIYNEAGNSLLKSVEFTSADELMPMKAVVDLEAGQTYKYQLRRGGTDSYGIYYGNSGTMTYANHGQNPAWAMTNSPFAMCGITTNAAGDYTFNLSYSAHSDAYRLRMAVDYPIASGDYRLVYIDNVGRPKASAIVTKVNNGKDTVSFFIRPGNSPALKIQTATVDGSTGAISWGSDVNVTSSISSLTKDSVYNICLSMNGSGAISVENVEAYTGNYYIRTDVANSKWDNYRSDPDHLMTFSEYSINHGGYSHYYCHWVDKDDSRKNVKFCIANDYSPSISDTLIRETASGDWTNITYYMGDNGDLTRSANVRFMWNRHDNTISRAYVDGAQGPSNKNFLYILNTDDPNMIRWSESSALTDNKVTFSDNGNWLYEANIQAQPNAQIKLLSNWGESSTITQYFKGTSSSSEYLISGSGNDWYNIRLIYDFKTNRLVTSYIPSGVISDNLAIHADVMFIREHQGDIAQLTFSKKTEESAYGSISDIETAYGVMRFSKWTLNNKSKETGHAVLSPLLSRYERDLFYISFPFRVNLEEVFGFGTYGVHWIIEEYDGAARAREGYWADSESYWKFITNRKGKFLEPDKGYILALDLDELGESSSVWTNTDQVELYFPSYGTMGSITNTSVEHTLPAHTCNIGPRPGMSDDRRVKDSHWNVMSVPTYVNTSSVTFGNNTWITAGDGKRGPKFLYVWNSSDNSLTATNGAGYEYHAMHAYMVQYYGTVTWTTSATTVPSSIAARMTDTPDREYKLELISEEQIEDQTFIQLTDDENVTTGFEFNYDLSKEMNKNRANIYTLISTTIDSVPSITEAAANVQPHPLTTTIVPVGVKIAANGEYTFSMPEGTNGGDVWLIDNANSSRTNLGLMDYTVNLTTGTYEGRFSLEFPVQNVVTEIENAANANANANADVRKVFVGGRLYILRDGKAYDATGAQVR